ncbi:unnamed protein product [Acanthoscelides obtectus]|uniref:Uncharacterized protein n=1 Tax=Acanthoscelides obtectus TaxID=200917 RepID=A0A9P0JPM9_ACAOB|nr:unnamed protein product [Acanthoscelides obtectus]CAH1998541.1 unnamed protein product [Acanthoscelides obtectus]CAK1621142.1 hypothetical protein AOBTE_LOCUS786 [Acanthoscelides obtectus]CAK1686785.1 hypothetical protein AOBTE_LOCUS36067 [Acanthoscelides obtectus]
MQRILSVETSRNSGNAESSEFVTKRLCCSVILTVTFFSLIGGFFLGRFVSERSGNQIRADFQELSRKVNALNNNFQRAFPLDFFNDTGCNKTLFLKCNFSVIGKNDTGSLLARDYLRMLNDCFGYG